MRHCCECVAYWLRCLSDSDLRCHMTTSEHVCVVFVVSDDQNLLSCGMLLDMILKPFICNSETLISKPQIVEKSHRYVTSHQRSF